MTGSLEEARSIFHNPLINWGAFYILWHCCYPIAVILVTEPLQHHPDSLVLVQMASRDQRGGTIPIIAITLSSRLFCGLEHAKMLLSSCTCCFATSVRALWQARLLCWCFKVTLFKLQSINLSQSHIIFLLLPREICFCPFCAHFLCDPTLNLRKCTL